MTTDIIIIGAGPGGYEAAVRAARKGQQVVIIEKNLLGGTCLNVGCIPTKCLCHTAEVLDEVRSAGEQGIATGEVAFSLSKAMERKGAIVESLRAGIAQLMKTPGITLVEGEARFVDKNTVSVGEARYEARNIIIATGSTTKFLPIPGAHAEGVLTSTEMLSLDAVPRRLCVIGGGVIGLEFASIFNAFGSEVTVVEFCKEVLPNFDRDIAKRLRTALKKRGIVFHTSAAAKEIHEGTTLVVDFEEKGKLQSVEADKVLMAVGRAANVDALNLADIGIDFTGRGITVDEHCQTSVSGVYAIGDANGLFQLAHAATFQGYAVVDHILGVDTKFSDIVPSAVFTVPEVAMVGKTEEQLEAEAVEYTVKKAMYRANGKALSMNADEGLAKILVAGDDSILGAHILGAHASDLIHEVAVVMNSGGSIADIAHTVHAHPSLSEILLAAAEA
ncbi:MAG: dihydrolipoyl dehydrogenase [Prevotella sp.]